MLGSVGKYSPAANHCSAFVIYLWYFTALIELVGHWTSERTQAVNIVTVTPQ